MFSLQISTSPGWWWWASAFFPLLDKYVSLFPSSLRRLARLSLFLYFVNSNDSHFHLIIHFVSSPNLLFEGEHHAKSRWHPLCLPLPDLYFPGAHILYRCIKFSRCTQFVLGVNHSLDDQHQWQVESPFSFYRHIFSLLLFQIDVNCLPRSDRTTLGSGASLGPFLSVSQSFSTARTRLGQVRTSTLLHYRWWTTYLTTTLSRRSTWRRATASRLLPVRFPQCTALQWRSQI